MYIYNNKITTIRLSVEGCEAICISFPYTLTPFWDPLLPNGPPLSSIELGFYFLQVIPEKTVQDSPTPVKFNIAPDQWYLDDDPFLLGPHKKKKTGWSIKFSECNSPDLSLSLYIYIYVYIYIYLEPKWRPVFIAKGLLFGGLNPQNGGQTGSSVYIYIYIWNQSRKQINGVSWFPQ